jgi:membrane protein YqaA with SNARE-associated domain
LKEFTLPKWSIQVFRGVVFLGLILLMIFLFSHRNQISQFGKYGYPGIFLVSLLANATLFLPLPTILISTTMGAVFNPIAVAAAAGGGAALGEITGYIAGYTGKAIIEKISVYEKMVMWVKKYGGITIFLLAFIPNPLFDITGIAAGSLKIPLHKYLLWSFAGKFLKMIMFAYFGKGLGDYFPVM